jgi:hypothetical protein
VNPARKQNQALQFDARRADYAREGDTFVIWKLDCLACLIRLSSGRARLGLCNGQVVDALEHCRTMRKQVFAPVATGPISQR